MSNSQSAARCGLTLDDLARIHIANDPQISPDSSLDGNVRRAIDIREGEKINAAGFKQLIRAAITANSTVIAERAAKKKK